MQFDQPKPMVRDGAGGEPQGKLPSVGNAIGKMDPLPTARVANKRI
jgi:hypothetical protein